MSNDSDNFNRADSTTNPGSTAGARAWSAARGTWGILSNALYTSASNTTAQGAILVTDFSEADCTLSVDLPAFTANSVQIGIVFRYVDLNNHWYWVKYRDTSGNPNYFLIKRVAGVETTVASGALASNNACTFSVVLAGSSIVCKQDGVTKASTTDSNLASATSHGFNLYGTTTHSLDNFVFTGFAPVLGAQATETDTGQTGGPETPVAGSKATETDTGNSGAALVVRAGSKASETDTGSTGTPHFAYTGAKATEIDTGHAGGSHTSGVTPPAPPGPSPTGGTPEPPGVSQDVDAVFSIRDLDDLATEIATITPIVFEWDDPENLEGSCRVVVPDDDPNIAEFVPDRAVVVELNGTEAFTVIIDEAIDYVLAPGEEHDQATDGTGRMLRSIADRIRVGPARGYGQSPWGDSRTFGFCDRAYEPGPEWVQATEIVALQTSPSAYYGGKPVGWFDPTAVWIAPSTGDDTQAQTGIWYAIGDFTLTEETDLVLIFAADNAALVFFDGFQVSNVSTDVGFTKTTRYTIHATPGSHRIAARIANYPLGTVTEPPFGGGAVEPGNPTGFICACFKVDNRGALGDLVIHTDYQWSVLEFPDDPPGMSIRRIIRLIIDENAVESSDLPNLSVTGTDLADERWHLWPIYEFITVDVSRSLMSLLIEWSNLYLDWDIPGPTNTTLHLWNWHTRGVTSGVVYEQTGDPTTSSLKALSRTDLPIISDALQVRWAGGWLRVPETGGTKVGTVKLSKAATVDEATRNANKILSLYGVVRGMWSGAMVPTSHGDIPYLDFAHGDSHWLDTHQERTVGIGGALTENGIRFTTKTKSLVQSAEDRVMAAIERMADGTLGGNAPGSPVGPSPKFGVDSGAQQQTFSVPNPIVTGPATKIDVFPFSGNLFQVMITLETPGWTDSAVQFLVDFGGGFLDVLGGNGIIPAGLKVVFIPVSFLGRSTVFITGGEGGDILSVNVTAVGVDAAGMTLKPVWL